MTDQEVQAQRVISLTEFPDGSALLEIEGEKPTDLSACEVKAMRLLFKPKKQKKAGTHMEAA